MGHIGIVLNKLSANNGEMSGHLYCVAKALCFVSGVLTSLALSASTAFSFECALWHVLSLAPQTKQS